MYSISGYTQMILDSVRMGAYEEALKRSVRPGSTVVDIGCGTGIASLLACRLGAGKVYAIEPDAAIQVAKEIAKANGCADRIEFIQDVSTRVELSEKADVVVSDLRGVLPLLSQHIPSLVHARTKLMKPEGTLIPQKDSLFVAVAEIPGGKMDECWLENWRDFDVRPALRFINNSMRKFNAAPETLLTDACQWGVLDYTRREDPNVAGAARLTVRRDGKGHGLLAWFDTELVPGVGFSNAPGKPEAVYGRMYFPWTRPFALREGDRVDVRLSADLINSDYLWRWETDIAPAATDSERVKFQQSTFFATPLALENLRKREASFVPRLNDDGRAAELVLSGMRDQKPLGEIAEELRLAFPERFSTPQAALGHVGELSEQFSQ